MYEIALNNGSTYVVKNTRKWTVVYQDDGSLRIVKRKSGKPIAFIAPGAWSTAGKGA